MTGAPVTPDTVTTIFIFAAFVVADIVNVAFVHVDAANFEITTRNLDVAIITDAVEATDSVDAVLMDSTHMSRPTTFNNILYMDFKRI